MARPRWRIDQHLRRHDRKWRWLDHTQLWGRRETLRTTLATAASQGDRERALRLRRRLATLVPLGVLAWILSRLLSAPATTSPPATIGGATLLLVVWGVLSMVYWRVIDQAGALDNDFYDRWIDQPLHRLIADARDSRQPSEDEWVAINARRGVPYRDYLHTDEWQQRRRFLFRRVGYRCQICNGGSRLEVHHRTYDRLGKERVDDLTVLCDECHRAFHKVGRITR